MSCISFVVYILGYLLQTPDTYICTYTTEVPEGSDICTQENICDGDPRIATWEADPYSDKYIDNWQQRLDLTCVDPMKYGMIGASLFIGWSMTLLWLPSFADRNGRRKYFFACMVLDLGLFTALMFTKNLYVMIAIFFCFGLLTSIRTNVGYVYLMEMLPKKAQTPVTTAWNVQEVMIYFMGTLYFWKICQCWFYFPLVGYAWQVISVIIMIWLPESPRYLVCVGKLDEAKKVFQIIAWFNNKELVWDEKLYTDSCHVNAIEN